MLNSKLTINNLKLLLSTLLNAILLIKKSIFFFGVILFLWRWTPMKNLYLYWICIEQPNNSDLCSDGSSIKVYQWLWLWRCINNRDYEGVSMTVTMKVYQWLWLWKCINDCDYEGVSMTVTMKVYQGLWLWRCSNK